MYTSDIYMCVYMYVYVYIYIERETHTLRWRVSNAPLRQDGDYVEGDTLCQAGLAIMRKVFSEKNFNFKLYGNQAYYTA